MYECPNCGGDLRFDIATKKLSCAFCNAKFDPYDDIKENKAEEHEEYEVTVLIRVSKVLIKNHILSAPNKYSLYFF